MAETPESIDANQVAKFADMVRSILPEAEAHPFVIEREDTGHDEDIMGVNMSADASYKVDGALIHVQEAHMDVIEISATTEEISYEAGKRIVAKKVYRVYPDDASSVYAERTKITGDHHSARTLEDLERAVEEKLQEFGARLEFDEKLGLSVFTQEKFDAVMSLLQACGPHNLLS